MDNSRLEPSTAIRMTPQVRKQYKESIAINAPETFALLGGSVIDDPFLITDFYFLPPKIDSSGNYVASASYIYPDHKMLNYIIDQVLVRNGRYMIGLWHSHPGQFNRPSHQDFEYCSQIIANDDSPGQRWTHFLAPITTFDAMGRDKISGWILPKGGSAFCPTSVLTEAEEGGLSRQVVQPIESEKHGVPSLAQSSPEDREVAARINDLKTIIETDRSSSSIAPGYIQQYRARSLVAQAERIIGSRYA